MFLEKPWTLSSLDVFSHNASEKLWWYLLVLRVGLKNWFVSKQLVVNLLTNWFSRTIKPFSWSQNYFHSIYPRLHSFRSILVVKSFSIIFLFEQRTLKHFSSEVAPKRVFGKDHFLQQKLLQLIPSFQTVWKNSLYYWMQRKLRKVEKFTLVFQTW